MLVSAFETSLRTRGRRRYFANAVLFSWTVIWAVEPELKNSILFESAGDFWVRISFSNSENDQRKIRRSQKPTSFEL